MQSGSKGITYEDRILLDIQSWFLKKFSKKRIKFNQNFSKLK
jgi:hypothetical protein